MKTNCATTTSSFFLPSRPAERCGEAYKAIDSYERALVAMEEEARQFGDLQELFELSASRYSSLKEMRGELLMLKKIWDTTAGVESLFSLWKVTLWADIQTDDLLDETKSLMKQASQSAAA